MCYKMLVLWSFQAQATPVSSKGIHLTTTQQVFQVSTQGELIERHRTSRGAGVLYLGFITKSCGTLEIPVMTLILLL